MSSQSIQRKIEMLTAGMLKAAEAEDFETAARLRNEIEQLKGQTVRKPPPGQMGWAPTFRSRRRPRAGFGRASPTR